MPVRSEEHGQDIRTRTFDFAVRIIRLCAHLEENPGVGRTLSRQLLRSGTSIGANIEEAQAGQSKADFIHKFSIALKEARETHYWLRLLEVAGIVPASRISELQVEAEEIMRITAAIIISAKRNSANNS
jgi:four helix bundle protein